jgi:hypothetical protein
MDRVTQRLWRGVEERRCSIYPMLPELFDHRARLASCCVRRAYLHILGSRTVTITVQ